MDCANTCSRTGPGAVTAEPKILEAAETLACLLTDLPEFQNFVRLARTVRMDAEVTSLLNQMSSLDPYSTDESESTELENQLEALPVIQEYRKAEQAVRWIFQTVENTISEAAGVAFAENAKPSACG